MPVVAARRLGAKGYRVEVIDRLDSVGGRGTAVTIDGHRFDLGPTIVTVPRAPPIPSPNDPRSGLIRPSMRYIVTPPNSVVTPRTLNAKVNRRPFSSRAWMTMAKGLRYRKPLEVRSKRKSHSTRRPRNPGQRRKAHEDGRWVREAMAAKARNGGMKKPVPVS